MPLGYEHNRLRPCGFQSKKVRDEYLVAAHPLTDEEAAKTLPAVVALLVV